MWGFQEVFGLLFLVYKWGNSDTTGGSILRWHVAEIRIFYWIIKAGLPSIQQDRIMVKKIQSYSRGYLGKSLWKDMEKLSLKACRRTERMMVLYNRKTGIKEVYSVFPLKYPSQLLRARCIFNITLCWR